MKRLALIIAAFSALALRAGTEALDIADGESVRVLAPGKVVAVRAASSVASGTVALKAAADVPVFTNGTVTTWSTNVLWRHVWTNTVIAADHSATNVYWVTNDYQRPYPYARPATTVSYGCLTTVTAETSPTRLLKQMLHPTNTLSSITCSGGVGSDAPSGQYVMPGDLLLWDGTAKGRVTVILER